jgi:hypothetical protein
MPDRLAEIRARLDAIGAWRLREEPEVFTQNAEGAFRTWAPHDIAWLLERESQMMGAIAVMTDLAAYDGGAQGYQVVHVQRGGIIISSGHDVVDGKAHGATTQAAGTTITRNDTRARCLPCGRVVHLAPTAGTVAGVLHGAPVRLAFLHALHIGRTFTWRATLRGHAHHQGAAP